MVMESGVVDGQSEGMPLTKLAPPARLAHAASWPGVPQLQLHQYTPKWEDSTYRPSPYSSLYLLALQMPHQSLTDREVSALSVRSSTKAPLAANCITHCTDIERIVAEFYKDADTFACIFNPTIKLPIARVNDDFCDCPDGSDEPGTAACALLSPLSPSRPASSKAGKVNDTLALPGFYCKNKGHRPSYVPFTNVNDGICDYELCCDGSDEYDRVGGVKCEDQCAKIGKEWKKQDDIRQKSLNAAQKRRQELIADAGRQRKEVEDRIETLKAQIEGQTVKVDALTQSLAELERQERGKVIRGAGKGGKATVLASLAKQKIEELTEHAHRLRSERDMAHARIDELESILSRFKEEYNPNFNDEGVKRAVKAWEDFAAQDRPSRNDGLDRDFDEILREGSEGSIKWEEFESNVEESDTDVRKLMLTHPCSTHILTPRSSLPV